MKKQRKLYIIGYIALALLAVSVAAISIYNANYKPESTAKVNQKVVEKEPIKEITYKGKDGISALELLKKTAKVTMDGEGEMAFVTSINGVKPKSNEFWQLNIDGEPAMVGAGTYISKSSETFTWKLATF